MSKVKMANQLFTTPHKYALKSTDGKNKKSCAHRYERRRIRESLKMGDFMLEEV
ncbi:MAG: hypothetical protein PHD76_12620 [Methylacidiphilales bacterium]|nr:hypothetical protein [Candidatus Methylacidiphilales bacterium]